MYKSLVFVLLAMVLTACYVAAQAELDDQEGAEQRYYGGYGGGYRGYGGYGSYGGYRGGYGGYGGHRGGYGGYGGYHRGYGRK